MAIYHLNVRGCSPATGAGAVKKAAYQSGQTLIEERTGEVCDYARKERVLDEGLALPAGVPPVGRGELWNEAERVWVEGGGGKTLVAKRYEFALPIELDEDGRRACVRDFCALFPAKACDWAIRSRGTLRRNSRLSVPAVAAGFCHANDFIDEIRRGLACTVRAFRDEPEGDKPLQILLHFRAICHAQFARTG